VRHAVHGGLSLHDARVSPAPTWHLETSSRPSSSADLTSVHALDTCPPAGPCAGRAQRAHTSCQACCRIVPPDMWHSCERRLQLCVGRQVSSPWWRGTEASARTEASFSVGTSVDSRPRRGASSSSRSLAVPCAWEAAASEAHLHAVASTSSSSLDRCPKAELRAVMRRAAGGVGVSESGCAAQRCATAAELDVWACGGGLLGKSTQCQLLLHALCLGEVPEAAPQPRAVCLRCGEASTRSGAPSLSLGAGAVPLSPLAALPVFRVRQPAERRRQLRAAGFPLASRLRTPLASERRPPLRAFAQVPLPLRG
jgi:hypothetical protein